MARRSSKFRRILWVALPLILSLVLLSLTASKPEDQESRWYETLFLGILAPLQRAATTVRDQIHSAVSGYIYLVDVAKENQSLLDSNHQLKEQILLYQRVIEENNRLRTLLEFKKFAPWQTVSARVIGHNPQAEFRLITIDRGTRDGVHRHMSVVATEGLVGQVYRAGRHASQVLLITDPTSAVDGRVVGTEARGLILGRLITTQWDRRHYLTALEFVDRAAIIHPGAMVLTSGMDGIFPEGIPIGTVRKVTVDPHGLFKEAEVAPQVELMTLREVLVILDWQGL